MSVASNTFKRGIKVRTKSGKPEQVLALASGAKVSVNDKELQTLTSNALNERTVGHIQKALGIPGKRNNLKGQGTKNILSFDTGAGGDDSSPDDDADNASEAPEGGMDMGGSDSADSSIAGNGSVSPFSGTDPDGFGAGSTPTPTSLGQDDPADTSYSSISGAKSGLTGSNIGAIQGAIAQAQDTTEMTMEDEIDRKGLFSYGLNHAIGLIPGFDVKETYSEDPAKASQTSFGLAEFVGDVASIGTSGLTSLATMGATKAFAPTVDKALGTSFNTSNPTSTASTASTTNTATPSSRSSVSKSSTPSGLPSGTDSGGDNAFSTPSRNTRAVRAASNNVDLATPMTETNYTREQLRRARRNITRYA